MDTWSFVLHSVYHCILGEVRSLIQTKDILTDEARHSIVKAFKREQDTNRELKGSPRSRVDIKPRVTFPSNLNAESREWLKRTGKNFGIEITFLEADRPVGNEGA